MKYDLLRGACSYLIFGLIAAHPFFLPYYLSDTANHFMPSLTNSDIIAVSSSIIAILALSATFWQAHIARRHNRLSVLPFMEHYQERIPGQHMSVSIANRGLGPAILESVFFTVSSEVAKLTIDDLLDYLLIHTSGKGEYETTIFQGKSAIPPGREITLLWIELTADDGETLRIMHERLNKVTFHIIYRCLYGTHTTYSSELEMA